MRSIPVGLKYRVIKGGAVVTLSIFSISEASMSFKFSSSRSLNALDIRERAS